MNSKKITLELTPRQLATLAINEASLIESSAPGGECPHQADPAAVLAWYRSGGRASIVQISKRHGERPETYATDPAASIIAAILEVLPAQRRV